MDEEFWVLMRGLVLGVLLIISVMTVIRAGRQVRSLEELQRRRFDRERRQ